MNNKLKFYLTNFTVICSVLSCSNNKEHNEKSNQFDSITINTQNSDSSDNSMEKIIAFCNVLMEQRLYGNFAKIKNHLHPLEWTYLRIKFNLDPWEKVDNIIDQIDKDNRNNNLEQYIADKKFAWTVSTPLGSSATNSEIHYLFLCERKGEEINTIVTKSILLVTVNKQLETTVLDLPFDKFEELKSNLQYYYGPNIITLLEYGYKLILKKPIIEQYKPKNIEENNLVSALFNFKNAFILEDTNYIANTLYPGVIYSTNDKFGFSRNAKEVATLLLSEMLNNEEKDLSKSIEYFISKLIKVPGVYPTLYIAKYTTFLSSQGTFIQSHELNCLFIYNKANKGWWLFEPDKENIRDVLGYDYSSDIIDNVVNMAF